MAYDKIRANIKSVGLEVFNQSRRIARNTIKREAKEARRVKKMAYPHNLGIYKKDVNHLTDF